MENNDKIIKRENTDVEKLDDFRSVEQVERIITRTKEILKQQMREDVHYGVIPGTQSKTLLKPGADLICMNFTIRPSYKYSITELKNDHREYDFTCYLIKIITDSEEDVIVGEGTGSCSTMESKYRYRYSKLKCPECNAEAIIKGKEEYGGGWLCYRKAGGCGTKFNDDDSKIVSQKIGRVENPDIADVYNTVKKIAKKRAYLDAVRTLVAADDIFVDPEEIKEPVPEKNKSNNNKKFDGAEDVNYKDVEEDQFGDPKQGDLETPDWYVNEINKLKNYEEAKRFCEHYVLEISFFNEEDKKKISDAAYAKRKKKGDKN